MFIRDIVWLLLVVLPLTGVPVAWGEGDPIEPAEKKAGLLNKITPVYSQKITGDARLVSMRNAFSNALDFTNGLKMTTSISVDQATYRDQDREDNRKSLSHSMSMLMNSGLTLAGTLSDKRSDNRIVTFGGVVQNYVSNVQQALVDGKYSRKVAEGLGMNGWTNLNFTNDEKNFKVDRSLEGSVGGGVNYRFGDRITASARGFLRKSDESSKASTLQFGGLGISQDSLRSVVAVQVTDSADVRFEYVRFNSTKKTIDLPRGTFLEQDLTAADLIRERALSNTRRLAFEADTRPIRGLDLKITATHEEQTNDFAVEKRRSSRTVRDILSGDLSYTLSKNTRATLSLLRKEVLHDLGPQSVSSYNEEQQNVRASLQHSFTETFTMGVQAAATLSQNFYIDFDINPNDQDQLSQGLSININSKPFSKISTSIMMSVSSIDFVRIHASKSSDNRRETTYDLRPRITYRLNERIEVQQDYDLNIEFTEFAFEEDQNFLDRNITFSNTISAKLSAALDVEFYYGLRLHDGGSYLRESPGAERLLDIGSEDRKDETRIKFEYRINDHLTVLGEHDYSRRVDEVVATGMQTEFTDGGIKGGLKGSYSWGDGQAVSFALLKANRFGRFNTDVQNDFWEMNSQIKYTF